MTRRRRSTTQARFEDTLAAAEALLQKRIQEREKALSTLSALAGEIPALEQTIRALKVQLNPEPRKIQTDSTTGAGDPRMLMPAPESIPPEVLAQLPADYLQPYTVPEDDSLPPIDGVDLIPEKE
jgi:hypothetical protein